MKKMKSIIYVLFIAFMAFNSCKKDDSKPDPTITFSDSETKEIDLFAYGAKVKVEFTVDVVAEGEIESFTLAKTVEGSTATAAPDTNLGGNGQTSFKYTFSKEFTNKDFVNGVTSIVYKYTVIDKQALKAEKTFTLTAKVAKKLPTVAIYLYDYTAKASNDGDCFASISGAVYKPSNVSNYNSSIDLCFGYDPTNYSPKPYLNGFLLSPNKVNNFITAVTLPNVTTFKIAPAGTDFDNATTEIVNLAWTNGTVTPEYTTTYSAGTIAYGLKANDLIVCSTQAGKKALIKVLSFTASSKTLSLDVKIAE